MTSFANSQPGPAFQVSETTIFTPDIWQSLFSRHPFYPAGNKAALTSSSMLFVKARAVAEKLLLCALTLSAFGHQS